MKAKVFKIILIKILLQLGREVSSSEIVITGQRLSLELPRHQFSSVLSDSGVFHSQKVLFYLLLGGLGVFSSYQIFVNSEMPKSVLGAYITGL